MPRKVRGQWRLCCSSTLSCRSGLFRMRPGCAAPAVGDRYGSPLKISRVPWHKRTGRPLGNAAHRSGTTRQPETATWWDWFARQEAAQKNPVTIVWIRQVLQTAGGLQLDSGQIPKLCCLCFLLSYLFFAHYNIQPDIVSSWPCITSVRNQGMHI